MTTQETAPAPVRDSIARAVRAMGDGPLKESELVRRVHPLFSRVLARDEIYLANHSLGRPLDATAEDLAEAMEAWYRDMDGAWEAWMGAIGRFRSLQAALIGCSRPDAVVPRVSAGQSLRAVLNALPSARPRVVASGAEFDSIDHILKTYHHRGRAQLRWVPPDGGGLVRASDVCDAIDDGTDLVVVSMVYFTMGQVLEGLERVIERARESAALVLLDCYHSAGAIPMSFDRLGADFAIGGNYKYTRGGPGAGWLAVHPRHLTDAPDPAIRTLDTGWFAKRGVFDFRRPKDPELAPGGDAWMEATPAVLTAYQALAGLELTLAIGVDRLRDYSLRQQAVLAGALAEKGVRIHTVSPRGAFMLMPTDDFQGLCARVVERGVNVDARPRPGAPAGEGPRPGFVRLCPDLLNTEAELREAAARIAASVAAD